MDRQTYATIKAQLDFRDNVLTSLGMLALDAGLLWAIWALLGNGGVAAYLLSQVLLAIVFFHGFCLLHEAGHGNCSRTGWVNIVIGHVASVLCFLPFYPWKHLHAQHHVWTGNPDRDPTNRSVHLWRKRGRVPWIVRAAWRSWIPLAALSQMVVFWSYPLRLLREDRSQLKRGITSVAFLIAVYGALYALAPDIFSLRVWGLAFVLYLFANELVNVPHHVDMLNQEARLPLWDQWKATRSCYYPALVSELLVLNFNFHIEHHLFPALPWFRLRRARELIRTTLGLDYKEAVGIRWNLRHRRRDLAEVLGVR